MRQTPPGPPPGRRRGAPFAGLPRGRDPPPAAAPPRARIAADAAVPVNLGPSTAVLALLLAALAVGTSAGMFGVTEAAAGVAPALEGESQIEPPSP